MIDPALLAVLRTRVACEETADLISTLPPANLRDLLVGEGPGTLDDDQVRALVVFYVVEAVSGRRLRLDEARRALRALRYSAREARRDEPDRPSPKRDRERDEAAAARVLCWCLAVADRMGP